MECMTSEILFYNGKRLLTEMLSRPCARTGGGRNPHDTLLQVSHSIVGISKKDKRCNREKVGNEPSAREEVCELDV
jgi:hypothetical protein